MTKIDIISGFLGAGKTTLIKKLLEEAFKGEKLVLIENEFGEIGIDGGFLKDAGVQITEMNSGCICCSLVGDFGTALKEVLQKFSPDRIIIEPSGVGKLSDVIKAVEGVGKEVPILLNSFTAVVDAKKSKMYMKNFGEFFNNQVEYAGTIVLSRSQNMEDEKLEACVKQLREHNASATIITTPWDDIDGAQILAAMEKKNTLEKELLEEEDICPICGHHHNHEGHDHEEHEHSHDHEDHDHEGHEHSHDHKDHNHEEHEHSHDHKDHDHEEHEHHHEHHDHDHEEHEHSHDHKDHDHEEHEHHHDHKDHDHEGHEHHHDGEECGCGHHHDHEHGHHHADEVFSSWGVETPHKFTEEELKAVLEELSESDRHGMILRAKGIVPSTTGEWLHFDLVPGEFEVRKGAADVTGRICVIGSKLKEEEIAKMFQV